jgi:hypothetical protein
MTHQKKIGHRLRGVLGSMYYQREDWGLFFSFLSHYSLLDDIVIFNADTHGDWISNIMFHSRGAVVAHCVCFFGPSLPRSDSFSSTTLLWIACCKGMWRWQQKSRT